MNQEKIGNFIKKLRIDNNMSQKALADKIPINREAISKWECGRTIPDSSTILRLCEIFNVSADEIMYGEYKKKDNKTEFDNLSLIIYDERNTIYKKFNKTSKFFLVTFILLIISIFTFLLYYFFNSYDSVKIYTIESGQGDIFLTDGIITLTGENIYFKLGNFNGIDEDDISKVVVYYEKDNTKKIVYESTSPKDFLIRDYYGYNEYFKIKNKDVDFDSLYVDVYYNNEVETIKLMMKEEYSNKRLYFRKKEQSVVKKAKEIKPFDNELTKTIKENLKNEENGIYYQSMKLDDNLYDVYYVDDTSTLLILWQKGEYSYSLDYDSKYESGSYKKNDSNLTNMDECYYDKNDQSKTTCDKSILNILDSIIKEITKGRS
ncbi:MAG: helix-turn-helix transcriptional regulator [Bacilli bacterium]|nr:helix-turn-helix transcriptional regulator [Bacilli bacterium]